MFHEGFCNTNLCLNLGYQEKHKKESESEEKPNKKLCFGYSSSVSSTSSEPALTLRLPAECNETRKNIGMDKACQSSGTQFFFNAMMNRERGISRMIENEEEESGGRKKLRLTKDQAAYLEASFQKHNALTPKQKKDLARQLNLRLRQVEVWFQNRRARSKLKRIEVDYENLKKMCETLKDENKRLQKDILDMKAIKVAQPLYMQLPAATLTLCPSCQRTGPGGLIKQPSATPEINM
ncbi:homeobox-leucine zipper protein [Ranunculus cassubicifolius]